MEEFSNILQRQS